MKRHHEQVDKEMGVPAVSDQQNQLLFISISVVHMVVMKYYLTFRETKGQKESPNRSLLLQ